MPLLPQPEPFRTTFAMLPGMDQLMAYGMMGNAAFLLYQGKLDGGDLPATIVGLAAAVVGGSHLLAAHFKERAMYNENFSTIHQAQMISMLRTFGWIGYLMASCFALDYFSGQEYSVLASLGAFFSTACDEAWVSNSMNKNPRT